MNKLKLLFLNIIILLSFNVSANNSALNESTSNNKILQITYYTYSYEIPPTKFAAFISSNKLNHGLEVKNKLKEVYSVKVMSTVEFDNLVKRLDDVFSEKTQGSDSCIINQGLCGSASSIDNNDVGFSKTSITFEPIMINTVVNVDLSYYYKPYTNKASSDNNAIINFSSFLSNAANKNYVVISKSLKDNKVYGQIILFSLKLES